MLGTAFRALDAVPRSSLSPPFLVKIMVRRLRALLVAVLPASSILALPRPTSRYGLHHDSPLLSCDDLAEADLRTAMHAVLEDEEGMALENGGLHITIRNLTTDSRHIPEQPRSRIAVQACSIEVDLKPIEDGESSDNSIKLEVLLPVDWNQRLLTVGNGAFEGELQYGDMVRRLNNGWAVLATNTGHNGDIDDMYGDEDKQADWGYRAMKFSVPLAKAVVSQAYGRAQSWSYFSSCSTGGRQGLRQLEEAASSFDGLLIGSPAWDTPNLMAFGAYIHQLNTKESDMTGNRWHEGDSILLQSVLAMEEVCGGLMLEGAITSPEKCKELLMGNPEALKTAFRNNHVSEVFEGLVSPLFVNDTLVYEGFDVTAAPWMHWVIRGDVANTGHGRFAEMIGYRYEGPLWNEQGSYLTALNEWNREIGKAAVTPSNLSHFDGNILLYAGLIDGIVPTPHTHSLFLQLQQIIGSDHISYFEIPGMEHCTRSKYSETPWYIGSEGAGIGWYDPGPVYNTSSGDALLRLVEWTEGGSQPTQLHAVSFKEGSWNDGFELEDTITIPPITDENRDVWGHA